MNRQRQSDGTEEFAMNEMRRAALADDVDIHDRAFVADPFGAFERLRNECPVAHSSKHGGFWLFTRYDDVRSAALDWRSFTSSVVGVTAIPVITPRSQPQLPIEIDPPQHSRYRALVNPVFAPARVAAITPRIEAFVRKRLEEMAAKGGADAVSAFCVPVAITSLAAFTDIPLADSERWVEWIARMFDVSDPARGAAAARELTAYVDDMIAARRLKPQGDFVSTLLAAEVDGERLDDAQIRSFLTVVFGAGFETTADALSLMLQWIAGNPDALARIDDPASISLAVEEFLRHSSPIQIFGRNATRDMCVHGRDIGAGDVVALAFGAANHDPAMFDDPEEMRLDRQPNRHLTFGAGPHLCAGASVARMEMAATLRMLIETGITLRPDPSATPRLKTRGDRHGLASLPLLVGKKTDRS